MNIEKKITDYGTMFLYIVNGDVVGTLDVSEDNEIMCADVDKHMRRLGIYTELKNEALKCFNFLYSVTRSKDSNPIYSKQLGFNVDANSVIKITKNHLEIIPDEIYYKN